MVRSHTWRGPSLKFPGQESKLVNAAEGNSLKFENEKCQSNFWAVRDFSAELVNFIAKITADERNPCLGNLAENNVGAQESDGVSLLQHGDTFFKVSCLSDRNIDAARLLAQYQSDLSDAGMSDSLRVIVDGMQSGDSRLGTADPADPVTLVCRALLSQGEWFNHPDADHPSDVAKNNIDIDARGSTKMIDRSVDDEGKASRDRLVHTFATAVQPERKTGRALLMRNQICTLTYYGITKLPGDKEMPFAKMLKVKDLVKPCFEPIDDGSIVIGSVHGIRISKAARDGPWTVSCLDGDNEASPILAEYQVSNVAKAPFIAAFEAGMVTVRENEAAIVGNGVDPVFGRSAAELCAVMLQERQWFDEKVKRFANSANPDPAEIAPNRKFLVADAVNKVSLLDVAADGASAARPFQLHVDWPGKDGYYLKLSAENSCGTHFYGLSVPTDVELLASLFTATAADPCLAALAEGADVFAGQVIVAKTSNQEFTILCADNADDRLIAKYSISTNKERATIHGWFGEGFYGPEPGAGGDLKGLQKLLGGRTVVQANNAFGQAARRICQALHLERAEIERVITQLGNYPLPDYANQAVKLNQDGEQRVVAVAATHDGVLTTLRTFLVGNFAGPAAGYELKAENQKCTIELFNLGQAPAVEKPVDEIGAGLLAEYRNPCLRPVEDGSGVVNHEDVAILRGGGSKLQVDCLRSGVTPPIVEARYALTGQPGDDLTLWSNPLLGLQV